MTISLEPSRVYPCASCGEITLSNQVAWLCGCGGLLELADPEPFSRAEVDTSETGFWRYAAGLGLKGPATKLGETATPLLPVPDFGPGCRVKIDYLLPSGSYKDRGAAFVVSALVAAGVKQVIEDSSGNAGAALAAYSTAAGIECTIYAPAENSAAKLAQIRGYGARLQLISGGREAVAQQAQLTQKAQLTQQAGVNVFYASHNYLPEFVRGIATLGLELWEQYDFQLPQHVVVPCGNGSLVLGLWHAFRALAAANPSQTCPRIHAVQSQQYPPVYTAWATGQNEVAALGAGHTLAEGIASRNPVRGAAILAAINRSAGTVSTVNDPEIVAALRLLTRRGFYPEPTGAVSTAGYLKLLQNKVILPEDETAVILTGSGLKTGATLADLLESESSALEHSALKHPALKHSATRSEDTK